MLSRLILLALQVVIAWIAAPIIVRYIPGMGRLELFVYAAVFAVLVWLVGDRRHGWVRPCAQD